jgi:uncharacterized membrane protein YccF (DUF307 family)
MRGSGEHIGSGDVGLVVAAVWMIVAGAWIALAGGFPIALALVVTGVVAVAAVTAATRFDRHGR